MGTYLEISNVFTKPEAEEGELVIVYLTLKNKHTSAILACLTGCYDTEEMQTNWATLKAGTEYSWNLRFTMPNKSVTVWVWACYQTAVEPYYVVDDEFGPISILLPGALPPEEEYYDGAIESLSVNGKPCPARLSYGDRFRIQFIGRNKSSVRVRQWASVDIYKPSGARAYHGEAVEAWPGTGPGGTHGFEFPIVLPIPEYAVTVDEYGNWTATIEIRVNDASGYLLAKTTKERILYCPTPEEEPEPIPDVYLGKIENKMIDRTVLPGGGEHIPLTVPLNDKFRFLFDGYNLSDTTMRLATEVWIYGPDGVEKYHHPLDVALLATAKGDCHHFVFPSDPFADTADELGDWTVKVRLTNSSGEYLLDEDEQALFTVEEVAPSPWSIIIDIMPLIMIMMVFSMMIPMTKELGAGE